MEEDGAVMGCHDKLNLLLVEMSNFGDVDLQTCIYDKKQNNDYKPNWRCYLKIRVDEHKVSGQLIVKDRFDNPLDAVFDCYDQLGKFRSNLTH